MVRLPIRALSLFFDDENGGIKRVDGDATLWRVERDDRFLAAIWWHDPPYRTYQYGADEYQVDWDASRKLGYEIPDADWERFRLGIHALPHPLEKTREVTRA